MNRIRLAALAAVALTGGLSASASATPYADAINRVSGISITGVNGPLPMVTGTATQGTTSAQFDGLVAGTNAIGSVGAVTDVTQGTVGTGGFPGENDFSIRAGQNAGMLGSRADGLISGGAAGTVSADTVAESRGDRVGSAQGKNTASINFTASLSDPGQIRIAFDLSAYLEAATAPLAPESANATIKNDILVTDALGNIVFEFTPNGNLAGNVVGGTVISDPFNANGQVNSTIGVPADVTFNHTGTFEAISNVLAAGNYNIAVVSSSQTSIQPGVAQVPEPASMGLLGAGLFALGLVMHRRPMAGRRG